MDYATLSKSIDINAPKFKVWEAITDLDNIKEWSAVFHEGSHMKGDFNTGSTVYFLDNEGNGLKGTVLEHRPGEFLKIQYESAFVDGKENTDSKESQEWKGSYDIYQVEENAEGVTTLSLESKFPASYKEIFDPMWDKALVKIKEIAEGK